MLVEISLRNGVGGSVLKELYWLNWNSICETVLVEKCWWNFFCGAVFVEQCWQSGVGGNLLVDLCW